MSNKSPNIYLSKKEVERFFKLKAIDIRKMLNSKLLKPNYCNGKVLFKLTDVLQASFQNKK
jgi:hypothetical protein